MNGKIVLYLDQYGRHVFATTVRELREKLGGGRVSKMYRDTKAGTMHVGYVVGPYWCEAFAPVRNPA